MIMSERNQISLITGRYSERLVAGSVFADKKFVLKDAKHDCYGIDINQGMHKLARDKEAMYTEYVSGIRTDPLFEVYVSTNTFNYPFIMVGGFVQR